MLDFEPITLDKKSLIERYFFEYGEGSCQHSFISSFCLSEKYGDKFCERDNFLYILRSLRCSSDERIYLFPQGDTENKDAVKKAITEIMNDAHQYRAAVLFETLTERAKNITLNLFPDIFTVIENRDYAEYVYSVEKLIHNPGHKLASRRKKIHYFFNKYGERFQISKIKKEHIPAIKIFQIKWLEDRKSEDDASIFHEQLSQENAGIQIALNNFFELGLYGVVAFLDGKICGYEYGAKLSKDFCDAIVQKGDRTLPEIYRVLDWEFLRLCFSNYTWVNWEEDLGIEKLRATKMHYDPDFMIKKFVLRENFSNGGVSL